MRITKITLGLCALLLIASPANAQNDEDRKVTVEIEVDENGERKRIKKEFSLKEGQSLDEALEELGIIDEMNDINSNERIEIDIRRIMDDVEKDMQFRFFNENGKGLIFGDCGPKPQLGVHLGSEDDGACITRVVEGSAADKAGLETGDCITAVDGKAIDSDQDLIDAIRASEINQNVSIAYTRNGRTRSTNARLQEEQNSFSFMWDGDELPDNWMENLKGLHHEDEPRPFLGVMGSPSEEGFIVSKVIEGSAAEKAGLAEGDIIRTVNDEPIATIGDLAAEIKNFEVGDEIDLEVVRKGKKVTLRTELGERERGPGHAQMRQFRFDGDQDVDIDFDFDGDDFDIDIQGLSAEDEAELEEAMEELRDHMRELKERMQEMSDEVRTEMRVVIRAEELDKDELKMLDRAGVEDLNKELDVELSLFPNPSDGLFYVNLNPGSKGDLSVEVYDQQGKQVYMEKLMDMEGEYNGTIDLSSRANGNYYLVVSHNGRTAKRKLSKQ